MDPFLWADVPHSKYVEYSKVWASYKWAMNRDCKQWLLSEEPKWNNQHVLLSKHGKDKVSRAQI